MTARVADKSVSADVTSAVSAARYRCRCGRERTRARSARAVFDLVDNQTGIAADHIGRSKRVVHAHAETLEHRTADVPANREGRVGMTSMVAVPAYFEPLG